MSAIASKAPAGDGDEGCLRNLAQLSSVSCQLRTSTGPLTALSVQATKKADPKGPCDTLKELMEVRCLWFWLFGITTAIRCLKQGATFLEK